MTIDEFEAWVNSPTNGPNRVSHMTNIEYIKAHIDDEIYYGYALRAKIKQVRPKEDRAFLLLKYGEYL